MIFTSLIHHIVFAGVYFVTLSLLAGGCLCFYGPGDSVVELTPQNFDTLAMSGDEMWIIEFYAPWWVIVFCFCDIAIG